MTCTRQAQCATENQSSGHHTADLAHTRHGMPGQGAAGRNRQNPDLSLPIHAAQTAGSTPLDRDGSAIDAVVSFAASNVAQESSTGGGVT